MIFQVVQKHLFFSLCFPYSEYSTCTQNITEIDFLCHHCLEVNPINSNTYVRYTIVYSVYICLYALYIYLHLNTIFIYLHLKESSSKHQIEGLCLCRYQTSWLLFKFMPISCMSKLNWNNFETLMQRCPVVQLHHLSKMTLFLLFCTSSLLQWDNWGLKA